MATKAEVMQLQRDLNAGGFADPPLKVDGILGPKTKAAQAKRDAAQTQPAAQVPQQGGQSEDEKIVALSMTQHGGVLAPFVNNPEIKALLGRYVRGEIDEDTLSGLIMQTPLWQTTSSAQRQWQTLETSDPASATSKLQAQSATIDAYARGKGVALGSGRADVLAKEYLRNGWNQEQLDNAIEADFTYNQSQLQGQAADFRTQVNNLAASYMIPMSEDTRASWVTRMVSGEIDAGYVDSQFRDYAKSLFPTIAADLDKGMTVAQYADPYKQLAAQRLGINPATIDFTDPKWGRALMAVDPKTNQRRPMTLDEWNVTLRNDERFGWGNSKEAQDESAALVLSLARAMGRR